MTTISKSVNIATDMTRAGISGAQLSTELKRIYATSNPLPSKMEQHTPGPWKIKKVHNDTLRSIVRYEVRNEDNNYLVANVNPGMSDHEANAELIARAPDLLSENATLKGELETERVRLAACGVVAMSNTPEAAAKNREMKEEYRSASLDDVIAAVDREMALREKLEAAESLNKELIEALTEVVEHADLNPIWKHSFQLLLTRAKGAPQ